MDRIAVVSKNIKSFGYEDGILEVEFNNGRVYRYVDVPPGVIRQMGYASSVGEFFDKNIRMMYSYQET